VGETNFLLEIHEQFGKDLRNDIYADESYLLSSHAKNKLWSNDRCEGSLCKGQRLISIHAGQENGIVPNAVFMLK
jgi:hypothetical protein